MGLRLDRTANAGIAGPLNTLNTPQPQPKDPNERADIWTQVSPFLQFGDSALDRAGQPHSPRKARQKRPHTPDKHTSEDNLRHDWVSNVMRGAALAGLVGTSVNLYRSGAASVYSKRNGMLGKWAWSMTPILGPGLNNDIMPFDKAAYKAGSENFGWETKWWARGNRTANALALGMSGAKALIAGSNLIQGFGEGYNDTDGSGAEKTLGGMEGLLRTKAGRTGMLLAVGPSITGKILFGAVSTEAGHGLVSVIRKYVNSPERSTLKLGCILMAITPLVYLNESGVFDVVDKHHPKDDDRSTKERLSDGVHALPETIRSIGMPWFPENAWNGTGRAIKGAAVAAADAVNPF